ncbi:MAG TPA: signal peptidase I [Nitrospira sp.]|nr:signal peptidase I [Nitrospira sp.]
MNRSLFGCGFGRGRGCSGLIVFCLMSLGLSFWTGCSETSLTVSHVDLEPFTAYQQLARLEVTSDRLFEVIAAQSDAAGYSRLLEAQSGLSTPLSLTDTDRIEQSFVHSLKVMLFDLAPTNFWENHLAEYYDTRLPGDEAQALLARYAEESVSQSSKLQDLRESFIKDRLPELLPVVRARSQIYQTPSQAMEPTVLPGDHVIVHQVAYQAAEPQQGDVVVYRYPDENGKRFLHRVIGLPGDQIAIRDQVVYLNGEALPEPYARHSDRSSMAGHVRDHLPPITVPLGTYFLMGDNREESLDSRFLGPISKDHVLGRALFIYWSVSPDSHAPRWERLNQLVR